MMRNQELIGKDGIGESSKKRALESRVCVKYNRDFPIDVILNAIL